MRCECYRLVCKHSGFNHETMQYETGQDGPEQCPYEAEYFLLSNPGKGRGDPDKDRDPNVRYDQSPVCGECGAASVAYEWGGWVGGGRFRIVRTLKGLKDSLFMTGRVKADEAIYTPKNT